MVSTFGFTGREWLWPFFRSDMYSLLLPQSRVFKDYVVRGVFRDKTRVTERDMTDDADFFPLDWDSVRKIIRSLVDGKDDTAAKIALRELLIRAAAHRKAADPATPQLVGYRLFYEKWKIDPDHFVPRGEPNHQFLIFGEDFE